MGCVWIGLDLSVCIGLLVFVSMMYVGGRGEVGMSVCVSRCAVVALTGIGLPVCSL